MTTRNPQGYRHLKSAGPDVTRSAPILGGTTDETNERSNDLGRGPVVARARGECQSV